jgi:hypothetical protein
MTPFAVQPVPALSQRVGAGRGERSDHRANRSRHHTKDKQRLVVSVVAYDSLTGHHSSESFQWRTKIDRDRGIVLQSDVAEFSRGSFHDAVARA